MPALSPLMTIMLRAAEKAGRSLMRDFGEVENLQVSEKAPGNFVTSADKRAEETIQFNLAKDRPDFGFLMEESGEIKGNDPERRWIVDPLDGTHNFMHGLPFWAVSIALEEKGEITAGLVTTPLTNEIFYAEKGAGAFSRKGRLRVSGRKELKTAVVTTWYIHGQEYCDDPSSLSLSVEEELRRKCGSIRQIGSTCTEYAWLAAGRIDGYIQGPRISEWDNAAGSILVREAGGSFSDWKGNRITGAYAGHIIAGNPDIHQALLSIAEKCR